MARRRNKSGQVHAHSENIQEQEKKMPKGYPRWPTSEKERALFRFELWAAQAPEQMYYDLLPPAVQMAVSAVGEVAGNLHVGESMDGKNL